MADFQTNLSAFRAEEIAIIAANSQNYEKTAALVTELGLAFSVGYGLDSRTAAGLLGGYYDEKDNYLHPTNIAIKPDGSIKIISYSSGAIGRMTANDALTALRHYKGQEQS